MLHARQFKEKTKFDVVASVLHNVELGHLTLLFVEDGLKMND